MNTQSNSVLELLDAIGDESLKEDAVERISERSIISDLIALRATHDVSQSDIAEKMGCTQSRVSKLERGIDSDLRLSDIAAYMACCGYTFSAHMIPSSWTLMDKIKHHAFQIVNELETMCKLSKGDEVMEAGAARSHVETLTNLVKLVLESAVKIPCVETRLSEMIRKSGSGTAPSTRPLLTSQIDDGVRESKIEALIDC
ncbi:MAG: helix-turn-helix domain-containing protein [Planctomycetaceae bacterium]|nr:helix-turn-helix domain-containing protein [Planctomycetaceae bacterium]